MSGKSKSLRRNPRRGIGFEEAREVFFYPRYLDQRSDFPVSIAPSAGLAIGCIPSYSKSARIQKVSSIIW
jgi:hypothetical protein